MQRRKRRRSTVGPSHTSINSSVEKTLASPAIWHCAFEIASPILQSVTFQISGGTPMRYKLHDRRLRRSGRTCRSRLRPVATDLEVTHWWTSGGEAAAVAEFAKAFDATGNKWVDGAIAGSGDTARPIMISRITGGDPMGATQFNHGRQAEELVAGGPDARPHRPRDEGELGGAGQSPDAARELHARRQDLLRAGQHPFLAVAVAVQQGLRGRRRAGSDELGRVRRRRARA